MSIQAGEEFEDKDVCQQCFDIEMKRRMTLNLQLGQYEYAVRSWEECCIPEVEAVLEKTAAAICDTIEEDPRAFLSSTMELLPKSVNDYILELLLERDLLFSAIGSFVVRLLATVPRSVVLSELEEALNGWEMYVGIQVKSQLAALKNGDEICDQLVSRAKAGVWKTVEDEISRM